VSTSVKRSNAGEVVFIERRRRLTISGIAIAVLLVPDSIPFFVSSGKDHLIPAIMLATVTVFVLSVCFGQMLREALRHRDRIMVTSEAITFLGWSDGRHTTFRREDGDFLLIFPRYLESTQRKDVLLTQLGTGRIVGFAQFPQGAVRRACSRRGWKFGYEPTLGELQLRLWRAWGLRDWGWLRYAASLVVSYGPVSVAAEQGGYRSLGAEILGEYAAGLPQDDRRPARAAKAYRLAADEQRSFAELATSPEQNAARLAEASKVLDMAESLDPRPAGLF
jgi:hypothetical protein